LAAFAAKLSGYRRWSAPNSGLTSPVTAYQELAYRGSSYARKDGIAFPPVYQIEHNNLGFDAMLGDGHEERAEKVLGSHISQSQERNSNPADGQIRTPCNIPAEAGEQSTHEI
jgi:hypothetical protein